MSTPLLTRSLLARPLQPFITLRRSSVVVCGFDSISSTLYEWWRAMADAIDAAFGCTGTGAKPTWINSGVSGNQTSDLLGSEQTRVLQYSPTHMIHMLGLNDCHTNGVTPIPSATSLANTRSYLRTIRDARPGLEVLMVGPWLYGGARPNGVNAFDTAINAVNAGQRQIAADYGYPFVDVRGAYFADATLDPTVLTSDGIQVHPTASGTTVGAGDLWLCAQARRRVQLDLS